MLTSPPPHSKTCDTFRAADASAIGTGLGRPSFADHFKRCAGLKAFVLQHRSEHRPASIRNGLRHSRLLELSRVYIANDDAAVLAHNPRRVLMQEVTPAILCLRMQRTNAPLLSSALSQSQPSFMLPVERRHLDLASVTESCKVLQAQINRDCLASLGGGMSNLCLHIEVPAPAGILCKTRALNDGIDGKRPGEPKIEFTLQQRDCPAIGIKAKSASIAKRYPAKRARSARSPSRTRPCLAARPRELARDPANRIAVQTKFCARTSRESYEGKRSRPPRAPSLSLALRFAAKIPHEIHSAGHAPKMLGRSAIFHAIAVGEDHELNRI